MNVTIFTSNQPRHTNLVEKIASIANHVYVIQECNTIFPGQVKDFFNRSDIMQEYFSHVIKAENTVFGSQKFSPANTSTIAIKMGDLSLTGEKILKPALNSDMYIIFGSSFIKGELCDFLIEKNAINIHMGLSPFYRGSSCNFWALYDNRPEYVGATIHLLSEGLDSGKILFHALPPTIKTDPFLFGMLAVKSAHNSLSQYLEKGENFTPITQNKLLEMRYTRNRDFTDDIAGSYLKSLSQQKSFHKKLEHQNIEGLRVYSSIEKF